MVRRVLTEADVQAIADAIADEFEARGLLPGRRPAPTILTAAQVAELLGRSRDWVYGHADELGAFRAGRRLGFRRSAIERWINEQTIAPRRPTPASQPPRRRRRAAEPQRVDLIPYVDDAAADGGGDS